MAWSDVWVGLPYVEGGRGPGFDCLGLFLEVQAAVFGRRLPDPALTPGHGHVALSGYARTWRPVSVPEEGAALVFRFPEGWHIGVAIDERLMLHTQTGLGASQVIEINAPRFGKRLEGIYRHAA